MAGPKTSSDESTTTSRKAADATHEAVDRAAEAAEEVERKVREKAGDFRDSAEQNYQSARARSRDLGGAVARYVDEKPLHALGLAFVAGLIAHSVLKKQQ